MCTTLERYGLEKPLDPRPGHEGETAYGAVWDFVARNMGHTTDPDKQLSRAEHLLLDIQDIAREMLGQLEVFKRSG